jgi:hypothetical protein
VSTAYGRVHVIASSLCLLPILQVKLRNKAKRPTSKTNLMTLHNLGNGDRCNMSFVHSQ